MASASGICGYPHSGIHRIVQTLLSHSSLPVPLGAGGRELSFGSVPPWTTTRFANRAAEQAKHSRRGSALEESLSGRVADNQNVFLSSPSDLGSTWTAVVRVNSGSTLGKANMFSWVAAEACGHVVDYVGCNRFCTFTKHTR